MNAVDAAEMAQWVDDLSLEDTEIVVHPHDRNGYATVVIDGPQLPFGNEWALWSGEQIRQP